MTQIRILIINEHKICRESIKSAIEGVSDIVVIGEAESAKVGLERIKELEPDLIIASSSLNDIPSYELTETALREFPNLGIIISVEQNSPKIDLAVKSLGLGAFDYLMTPNVEKGSEEHVSIIKRRLLSKIRSFSTAKYSRMAREMSSKDKEPLDSVSMAIQRKNAIIAARLLGGIQSKSFELVVIGVSTGGPEALSKLVPALPASFPVPVAIVLHLPQEFTKSLVTDLNQKSALHVKEATEGELVRNGCVYVARGGTHLLVKRDVQKNLIFRTSDSPPRQGCKPSVDVLFESAALACPNGVIALILTGMGTDGVKGLGDLKKAGAKVIAQDEVSSVVWGMPGSAVRENLVDFVKPLDRIAEKLCSLLEGHDKNQR